MTAPAHAVLAPSSAPQWAFCSGSVRAQQGRPSFDNEASREGEAAHWLAEQTLRAHVAAAQSGGAVVGYYCRDHAGTAPNGVVCTDEIVDSAQVFASEVLEVAYHYQAVANLRVELRVSMANTVHPDNWGTLDAALYLPAARTIYLWDYKHGHRTVSALGNYQLVNYMAGLLAHEGIDGHIEPTITAHLSIVQPRSYGAPSRWSVPLSDLRPYYNHLHRQAHEALGDDPRMTPGAHCRDCLARADCTAAREYAYSMCDIAGSPMTFDSMTPADKATELRVLRDGLTALQARYEAIEAQLTYDVQGGDTSSGMTLEPSRGRESWDVPDAQVQALFGQFDIDVRKPSSLTPNQARDRVPPELRDIVLPIVRGMSSRKAGKLKLVQAGDTVASRVFKKG